jgi:surface polysaccharide O-acyltransferase-like enzyme
MKDNCRKYHLDVLRICAILAVLLMHSTGFYDDTVSSGNPLWILSIIFGSITRFAVPVFLMISGSLLLEKESLSYKLLYSRNILRFVVAYFFWSFVYIVAFSVIPYHLHHAFSISTVMDIIAGTLAGGYFHLWYMPLIIGLYVLAPVLHSIVRKTEEKTLWYWMMLTILLCFVLPLFRRIPIFESILGESIDIFKVGFYGEYLFYFVSGYLLSQRRLPKALCSILYLLGIISTITTIGTTWVLSVKYGELVSFLRENNTPNVMLMSISLFVFVQNSLTDTWTPKYPKMLLFLSKYAFGVYLIHELILEALESFVSPYVPDLCLIPTLFVTTTVLCYIIIWLIGKIKPLSKFIM